MRQISIPLACVILVVYTVVSTFLFFSYGLPSLEGEIPQQMYSDAITYEIAAASLELGDELVAVDGNYLGPVLLLKTFSFSRIAIHFFNLSLILLSGIVAFNFLELNRGKFIIYIFSSPLLLFSTFGVNKEIFLLPFSVFLLIFLQRRTVIWFIFAIITGIFVRWQIVVFALLVLFIASDLISFNVKRSVALVILVAAISIAYPMFAMEAFATIEQISVEGALDERGSQASGLYSMMQEFQRSYGYFLVVIPKTLQLLIGLLSRFSLAEIELDFWNNFVIMFQSLHNFVLLGLVVFYKKFDLSNNCLFLICIFAIVFGLTPVFAPRYLYPISIWLAIWLALPTSTPINKVGNLPALPGRQ